MVWLRAESLFYSIGAYLHELGHLFGLDHGQTESPTIMSSSKGYIDSGKDFFRITPRFCSVLFDRRCSCYQVELRKWGMNNQFYGGILRQIRRIYLSINFSEYLLISSFFFEIFFQHCHMMNFSFDVKGKQTSRSTLFK